MAMTSSGMANYIMSHIRGLTNPASAIDNFYKALRSYVDQNAEVHYSWAAFNGDGDPDPMTQIVCKVVTSGTLTLSYANTPQSSLDSLSSSLNTRAAIWRIQWPAGFSVSPAFVIPTIHVTLSYATTMSDGWLHICSNIIAGLKRATPAASGIHGSYSGNASFISLL